MKKYEYGARVSDTNDDGDRTVINDFIIIIVYLYLYHVHVAGDKLRVGQFVGGMGTRTHEYPRNRDRPVRLRSGSLSRCGQNDRNPYYTYIYIHLLLLLLLSLYHYYIDIIHTHYTRATDTSAPVRLTLY